MKEKIRFIEKIGLFIATGFGSGLSPFAPGTAGTIVAIPIVYFSGLAFYPWLYITMFALFFTIGVWASSIGERYYESKDPGKVNIDEIAGFFVCMFYIPVTWKSILAAFLIFRFFDILKPFPIRYSEKLRSGWGIMADDIIAGFYSFLFLQILLRLFPDFLK